ncbi:extracellular solute-binding protein [Massilia terrae]|uniref:Extracellular solute-binding protein n=1 Tax=Massilia terrae TaxID=1811224 RepID=A0ABT2D218_9BURK|nr:extracellular solute-binding protein [Massilia terrae]MCS0660267.1 extracellular solute-binding protein [Massilia terrae]
MSRGWIAALLVTTSVSCAAAPTEIRLWRHETANTGTDAEMMAGRAAVARFNASQDKWKVVVESMPQATYTAAITAASMVNQLPCVIAIDQPIVPNFAWAGHIRPLDDLLPRNLVAQLLPGGRGTYGGRLYSVGQFDVSLALYSRRSQLAALGVRVATLDHPYSAEEFYAILDKVKRSRTFRFPLDLNGRARSEWLSYAFSPWLQSAGADLIDRSNYLRVDGVLNSPAALSVARYYARLHEDHLVERNPADERAFEQGRALFHYTGSWKADDYDRQFGRDLVVMPPPDFGKGPRIGAGSWQWAISRNCKKPDGAAAFLAFLIEPEEMAAMSRATGFVPVSAEAAALTEHYKEGGSRRIYFELAQRYAVPRPATPAYPAISSIFEKTMLDLRAGKAPADAMDEAVEAIEYNIARNSGYGFSSNNKSGAAQ